MEAPQILILLVQVRTLWELTIKLVIDASQLHATLLIHIPQRNILWHQQVNQVNQEKLHYSPEMVELD